MSSTTPLYDAHVAAGAKLVEFAGFQMPLHYGSQIEEHHAVRVATGVFDVSHMVTLDVEGGNARDWLRTMLANDVARLKPGRALYSCLCNDKGGVLDDLIVYYIDDNRYRLVVNAANRDKDIGWLEAHLSDGVTLTAPPELAMLAVQGPASITLVAGVINEMHGGNVDLVEMPRFSAQSVGDWFVARTGYTGEDGVEVTLPAAQAMEFWKQLLAADAKPVGLGARDTLRLEAGMCLYGNDLDESHSPIASGLAWTVDIRDEQRQFIGREVLEDHKMFGAGWFQVGLILDGRGVLRGEQVVELAGRDIGRVTSGTFSPTLGKSIALARVNKDFKGNCDVIIRGKPVAAHVVSLPFVKHGLTTF